MNESEQLIVDILEQSVRIYCEPPVYWKDPHGFQVWARAQSLFRIEGGVRATSADDSAAGRQRFSRLRRGLEAAGLIRITSFGPTSLYVALTTTGLAAAEKLTGTKAPADLREATEAMARESEQA